ncbi:MAG: flagellar assembly protein FliW [Candidatus Zixiibacteriota bacterium]|nr:MAG: flagellar assembly protein FliW [candidate division Zixibacteria bacterium]
MIISTVRFGDLDIPDDKIITMPKPVLGFEQLKRYCIIERDDCEPFLWYQSVDDPAVAFIIVNPLLFRPDYRIEVNVKELEELRIADVKHVETYVVVTIPSDFREMTLNFQGPILINTENRLAKQLVLVNSEYKVNQRILQMDSVIPRASEKEPVETVVAV